jgi:hypothetical protein
MMSTAIIGKVYAQVGLETSIASKNGFASAGFSGIRRLPANEANQRK